jgi:hypothetical protein
MDGSNTPGKENAAGWAYHSGNTTVEGTHAEQPANDATAPPPEGALEWTASEFITHHRGPAWYVLYFVASVVIAGIIYLLTRDRLSGIVVFGVFLLFGFAAANRKPRVVKYQLGENGFRIGQRFYPYSDYRSFTIVDEGPFSSISLLPLKRFGPPVSMYVAPEMERDIFEALGQHLPAMQGKLGLIDELARLLRL